MSDKFIRRSRKTAARMVGGEMVVLSVVDSSLYNLNAIASLVWQAADGATPLRAIVEARIVPHFEIDAENTAYAALCALSENGQFDKKKLAKAVKDLDIDPDKADPATA